jgi:ppGpp synthetase/RelA/SpoT-type nucleotidyltranferase
MNALEQLRDRWIEERIRYASFARCLEKKIDKEARQRGITCAVTSRAKEVDSLIRKQIRKNYDDPWAEMGDKAGVRIVVMYRAFVPLVRQLIEQTFNARKVEDKATVLGTKTLGYNGIHYEVSLIPEGLNGELVEYEGLIAEIQIHTRGQALWAESTHDLLYKPAYDVPEEIERMINCLSALLEIFDKEMEDARSCVARLPGYEEHLMLEQLKRQHYVFTTKTFDHELSLVIVGHLKPLFTDEEIQGYEVLIDEFVAKEGEKLSGIYNKYLDDSRCSPLLFQPESLLIFERLERDMFKLKEAWDTHFPPELLDDLAVLWGKPLPTGE